MQMYIPDSKGLFFLTASAAQVCSVAADGRLVRGLAELTLINFKELKQVIQHLAGQLKANFMLLQTMSKQI